MPLRTHPREVIAKPVGATRQEVQECQEDRSGVDNLAASREEHKLFNEYAVVWAAETNLAASHRARKLFDKYAAVLAAETLVAPTTIPT